jgi:hypothetical protein
MSCFAYNHGLNDFVVRNAIGHFGSLVAHVLGQSLAGCSWDIAHFVSAIVLGTLVQLAAIQLGQNVKEVDEHAADFNANEQLLFG